jgi:peroxiredoxin Q/BCP
MLGKPVPDFSRPRTGGTNFVPCFYPKDDTPGCSAAARCEISGVSRDSLESHESFTQLKNMYGKKVRGIERSTFVIDEKGKLAREWRGVKVPGHVEEVLSFAKAL